jgi:adenylylsulfate kinase-like enzyme
VPRFYLDVLDGDQVIQDLEGIDFADRETAIAEAAAGARDLVAHGIMQNQDVSGQSFRIRDTHGETVATVSFRGILPGRLRG